MAAKGDEGSVMTTLPSEIGNFDINHRLPDTRSLLTVSLDARAHVGSERQKIDAEIGRYGRKIAEVMSHEKQVSCC